MSKLIRRRVTNPVGSPFASPKAVVQQHFAKEVDVNEIVARAKRGIAPSRVNQSQGQFADLSSVPQDLTEAFSRVEAAWDLFEQLPARAREELGNDPRRLSKAPMDFFVKHGLASLREAPESSQVPRQGAGGAAPAKTSKKSSRTFQDAPASRGSDQDDQE